MDRPLTAAEVEDVVRRLEGIARDREGVPMYLVLEDRAPDAEPIPSGPERNGAELASLADTYRAVLFGDASSELDETRIAQVLEVLAAAHFRRVP